MLARFSPPHRIWPRDSGAPCFSSWSTVLWAYYGVLDQNHLSVVYQRGLWRWRFCISPLIMIGCDLHFLQSWASVSAYLLLSFNTVRAPRYWGVMGDFSHWTIEAYASGREAVEAEMLAAAKASKMATSTRHFMVHSSHDVSVFKSCGAS